MTDIMVDLETMGEHSDAAIIAIGAVEFDIKTKTLGREFYEVVDLASSMAAGGTVDASTILWWMKQSDAARKEFERKGIYLSEALLKFRHWVGGMWAEGIWGNGAPFDNVILRTAYERLSILPPWDFHQDRCFRTVKETNPPAEVSSTGTAHKALYDAKRQALYLMEVLG